MKTMTLDDFQAACMERFPSSLQTAVKCPMCGTIQTAQDFIDAGQGRSFDDVQGKLGYSCIGRYTGAGRLATLAGLLPRNALARTQTTSQEALQMIGWI